jgi:exosortase
MVERWSRDPRYAHGYFVPIFSSALLWMRRQRLQGVEVRPSMWGLAALGLGAALQLVGGYYRIESIEGLALLPDLVGICLLVGGWAVLAWAWPAIAFLGFMVPLPWRLETALAAPLQYLATSASTYLLQTLGFMAFAEGNVIQLNQGRIGVVDACCGLSMLITFLALSTAAALVVRRPLLDNVVLVASAVPVALLANVLRIVLAGVLHETVGRHASSTFYHDLAGWVMMSLALALYWAEIWILPRLLFEVRHGAPTVLDLMGTRRPATGAAARFKPSTS